MSGTTSVPKPSFTATGFVPPAEPDVYAGVFDDVNAAFGGNLNPAVESPQGQLCTSETAVIGDKDSQFCALANGVDPAYATGRMQDAIARIYFIERFAARATVVTCRCSGLANVPVPTGQLVQAVDGNLYSCTGGAPIGTSGFVDLPFACTVTGPISCPAGTIGPRPYQSLPGLDSIVNLADGVVGALVESRAQFELRRQAQVAKNSVGALAAIRGAVLNVSGVLDVYTLDNVNSSPVTVDGITIPAHGILVVVVGGTDAAVAQAIFTKKDPGPPTAGSTSVVVQDTQPPYVVPFPTYTINFQRPTTQSFVVLVSIKNSVSVPANALALIQTAVLAAFGGTDGGPREGIHSLVLASRFYAGVQALGSWAEITTIKIGSIATTTATFTASLSGTTLTVTAVSFGTVQVGDTVFATGTPDGMRIAALGTGSGGIGTYITDQSGTVGSEPMFTVTPNLDSVQVGEAHVAVLDALDIYLALV